MACEVIEAAAKQGRRAHPTNALQGMGLISIPIVVELALKKEIEKKAHAIIGYRKAPGGDNVRVCGR